MKAWQYHPNQENTEHLFLVQRNSIIMSSVIHELIVEWTDANVEETYQDLEEIKEEHRIKPRLQVIFIML
jgi:hypothetical protein